MKSLITLIICSFFAIQLNAQDSTSKTSKPDPTKKIMIVEASCGQCQFKIKGGGCDLAVRFDGKGYFVDGTKIDEHGDAHAAESVTMRLMLDPIQTCVAPSTRLCAKTDPASGETNCGSTDR